MGWLGSPTIASVTALVRNGLTPWNPRFLRRPKPTCAYWIPEESNDWIGPIERLGWTYPQLPISRATFSSES